MLHTTRIRFFERMLAHKTPTLNADEIILTSVQAHVARILNTRRGTVAIDLEYGIPDVSNLPGDFSSPKTDALTEDICLTIEKFESRVKGVQVRFLGRIPNKLALRFSLSVEIKYQNGVKRSQWDAVVGHENNL